MTTTNPTTALSGQTAADDPARCAICGGKVSLTAPKSIEDHPVCDGCFGTDPTGEIEPPF